MIIRIIFSIAALITFQTDAFATEVGRCTSVANDAEIIINTLSGSTGTTHEVILQRPSLPSLFSRTRQINLNGELDFFADITPAGYVPLKLAIPGYSKNKTAYSDVNLILNNYEVVPTGEAPKYSTVEYKLNCRISSPLSYSNPCKGKSQANELLLTASRQSNALLAEQALSCGADINHQDKNGCSSLISSIEIAGGVCRKSTAPYDSDVFNRQTYIANRLLDLGAYYDTADKVSGQTALHRAVSFFNNGDYNVLKLLIAVDADVNAQDNQGLSPIMLAAKSGLRWSVEALLEADPDLSLVDANGKTAYDLGLYLDSNTRDKLAAVSEEVVIEGLANGSCSPLSVELPLNKRVRVTMKTAANNMYMLTAASLDINLMASDSNGASKVIEVKSPGTYPFECGVHGGTQNKGQFIVK